MKYVQLVTPCSHSGGMATCKEMGYTGATYCADCGDKLASGEEIPMLESEPEPAPEPEPEPAPVEPTITVGMVVKDAKTNGKYKVTKNV